MKYSGSDFKMTSQANHLSKLLQLKSENVRESAHAQRLYKRRRNISNGHIESNWDVLRKSVFDDSTGVLDTWKPIEDSSYPPVIPPNDDDSVHDDDLIWEHI